MTPEQQAAVERLRKLITDGFEAAYVEFPMGTKSYAEERDHRVVSSLYIDEHPSDAPSVTDDDDCIKWPEPKKRRVPNPLADELREARRLLDDLEEVIDAGIRQLTRYRFETDRLQQSTRYDVLRQRHTAFLARTAWVEQQETK